MKKRVYKKSFNGLIRYGQARAAMYAQTFWVIRQLERNGKCNGNYKFRDAMIQRAAMQVTPRKVAA